MLENRFMNNKTPKFESIDAISIKDSTSHVDIQYIECRGILRREEVTESSGAVRSSEVVGRFQRPVVGKIFTIVSEPFDKNLPTEEAVRVVSTSLVQKLEDGPHGLIYFWTENSKYSLTIK